MIATLSARGLCGQRIDNSVDFTATSFPIQGTSDPVPLTSCFTDVVLVPLASWIFLICGLLWCIRVLQLKNSTTKDKRGLAEYRRGGRLTKITCGIYTFLIVATFAMNILVLARLSASPEKLGVGLLFFTPISIGLALICMHLKLDSRLRPWTTALTLSLWGPAIIFTAVQLRVQIVLRHADPRIGTGYPAIDEITDLTTLTALYAIILCAELIRLAALLKESSATQSHSLQEQGEAILDKDVV